MFTVFFPPTVSCNLRNLFFDPNAANAVQHQYWPVLMPTASQSEDLESHQHTALSVMADQSMCVVLLLPTVQAWWAEGKKATGKVKDVLGKLKKQVEVKKLSMTPCLSDAMTFLL